MRQNSAAVPQSDPSPTLPDGRRIAELPLSANADQVASEPELLSNIPPLPRPLSPANAESDPSLIGRELRFQHLQELKRILRHGTYESEGQKIMPYVFHAGSDSLVAETAGLEGFIFSEREFCRRFGEEASVRLIGHYVRYVMNLLGGASSTQPARERIAEICNQQTGDSERYREFIRYVSSYVEDLRVQVRTLDPAHWSHWARAYHVFIRAFNLPGRREAYLQPSAGNTERIFSDLSADDIAMLRSQSFNCIRLMGTYPIGEAGRKGNAGGSPFALKNFEVDPIHGDEKLVNEFIRGAAAQGVRTIFEIVLNHTALDSVLLEHNPRYFVHTQTKPADPAGFYHYHSPEHGEFWIRHGGYEDGGKRVYWDDTLQLDLANPGTRRLLPQIVCEIVRRYGPHGLRFDAAENMVHDQWARCWGNDCARTTQLPNEEILAEIVHAVKARFPSVICVAEAYKWWDRMSEMGFDLIYGFEDMDREVEGVRHRGWQASLLTRDPERIREALRRAQFLHWQEGGADMVTFWGHQDKAGPWRLFGADWKWGAAALTILKPGPFCFYAGTEANYECPETDEPGDPKVVTFNRPASIDWSGINSEFGRYQRGLLAFYTRLQRELGDDLQFTPLRPRDPAETWVGYAVHGSSSGPEAAKTLVIVNPAQAPTAVSIHAPELGIPDFERILAGCGKEGVGIYRFKSLR